MAKIEGYTKLKVDTLIGLIFIVLFVLYFPELWILPKDIMKGLLAFVGLIFFVEIVRSLVGALKYELKK